MNLRSWAQHARDWRTDPLVLRFLDTPPGQLVRSLIDIQIRDRALGLAGQAFIAMVPLVIILATWLSSQDGTAVGNWLISRFALDGATAESVDQLFASPPSGASGISLLSLAILLVSVNSFARSLQRIVEIAWRLPQRARRRGPSRFASLVVLGVLVLCLSYLTGAVDQLPVGWLLAVPVQLLVAAPAWLLITVRAGRGRDRPHLVAGGAGLRRRPVRRGRSMGRTPGRGAAAHCRAAVKRITLST